MVAKNKFLHYLGLPFHYFRLICFWVGFAVITMIGVTTFLIFLFFHNLPDVKHTTFNELKTIAQKEIQNRYENKKLRHRWVSIQNINRDLIYTLVMAEDADYFKHRGIDHDAIINALFENVKADEIKYGASTISQQVAKNLYLSNERSLVRKIKEYFITRDLEKYLSKNEILEIYLNMAEFGPDIYGVAAAAKTYFNTTPKKVHAAQGAFIALMLPSPRKYHYTLFQNRNFTPSLKRKYRRILRDMRFKEYISPAQFRRYLNYPIFASHKK